jgi:peptide/nickel transport system permease protein
MSVDSSLIGTTATAPLAPRLSWPEQMWTFARAKPLGAAGAFIILVMLLVAVLAPVLAPYDPYVPDYAAQFARPGAEHWLGTDEFGRDILSRIMYGARIALFVGFTASFAGCRSAGCWCSAPTAADGGLASSG